MCPRDVSLGKRAEKAETQSNKDTEKEAAYQLFFHKVEIDLTHYSTKSDQECSYHREGSIYITSKRGMP